MNIRSIRRYFKADQSLEPTQWMWFQISVIALAILIAFSHCFTIMAAITAGQTWLDIFLHGAKVFQINDWNAHDGVLVGGLKLCVIIVYVAGIVLVLVGAFVAVVLPWVYWQGYAKRYKQR